MVKDARSPPPCGSNGAKRPRRAEHVPDPQAIADVLDVSHHGDGRAGYVDRSAAAFVRNMSTSLRQWVEEFYEPFVVMVAAASPVVRLSITYQAGMADALGRCEV